MALKKFFAGMSSLIFLGVAPEIDPILQLEKLEKKAPSQAGAGLQMAVDDILNQSIHWSKEELREYDRVLGLEGRLTVSEVRKAYWKKIPRLLKSKDIRTEVDIIF
ncbi:MAG: hypothetical protein H0U98_04045 [Alphaproteobacteria bacterium]|nr:hypothetical protein [Alphaproteobacteria bacterium]